MGYPKDIEQDESAIQRTESRKSGLSKGQRAEGVGYPKDIEQDESAIQRT